MCLGRPGEVGFYRAQCVLTPFSEMAAHIVILVPRWPGVSVVARCPMRLRPRLWPFDRLNPALSTKTRMWVVSCPSNSMILYEEKQKQHKVYFYSRVE